MEEKKKNYEFIKIYTAVLDNLNDYTFLK